LAITYAWIEKQVRAKLEEHHAERVQMRERHEHAGI
jgi:hypothetical protein